MAGLTNAADFGKTAKDFFKILFRCSLLLLYVLFSEDTKQALKYKINRKPSQIKKLSKSGQYRAKKTEHKKSNVRAKVEHVFAVVKRIFGYHKTRYRGLRKQTAKLNMMFALANLYLADRKNQAKHEQGGLP